MILFAVPIFEDKRPRTPQYHQRANRLALILFAVTLLVGFAIKYGG